MDFRKLKKSRFLFRNDAKAEQIFTKPENSQSVFFDIWCNQMVLVNLYEDKMYTAFVTHKGLH